MAAALPVRVDLVGVALALAGFAAPDAPPPPPDVEFVVAVNAAVAWDLLMGARPA